MRSDFDLLSGRILYTLWGTTLARRLRDLVYCRASIGHVSCDGCLKSTIYRAHGTSRAICSEVHLAG
eukprot:2058483-Amphidinium_carterae.1